MTFADLIVIFAGIGTLALCFIAVLRIDGHGHVSDAVGIWETGVT